MSHDSVAKSTPIFITGAGRNIGAFMARRFLEEGFRVIIQYRSTSAETNDLAAHGAELIQGEFSNARSILRTVDAVKARTSSLRAVIHNASAFAPTADDAKQAAEQFQRFFEVHMLAPYLLNTRLSDIIHGDNGRAGDIIHITDIYADNPATQYDVYCATKAGLQNLSLSFAKRLAPAVKVNTIQPGAITFEDWLDEDQRKAMLATTPLQRTGAPDNIYRAARALMDNDYQTGAVIAVDGGRRLAR